MSSTLCHLFGFYQEVLSHSPSLCGCEQILLSFPHLGKKMFRLIQKQMKIILKKKCKKFKECEKKKEKEKIRTKKFTLRDHQD